jgi:dual specificity tyrosine-phosphorylation-regulated kinase 2/3/4
MSRRLYGSTAAGGGFKRATSPSRVRFHRLERTRTNMGADSGNSKRSKTLAQVLKCDDEHFIDFIARCLTWDPDRRLRPQTALRHPFCRRELRAPSSTSTTTLTSAARASRSSVPTSTSSAVISSPRRKQAAVISSLSTPQNSGASTSVSTAPVQRISTSSSLYRTGFGSSSSVNRFPVKSNIWFVVLSSG